VKQRKYLGVLAKRSSDKPNDKSGVEGVLPWNKQLECQGNKEVKGSSSKRNSLKL
jgi:hypothetical protein